MGSGEEDTEIVCLGANSCVRYKKPSETDVLLGAIRSCSPLLITHTDTDRQTDRQTHTDTHTLSLPLSLSL